MAQTYRLPVYRVSLVKEGTISTADRQAFTCPQTVANTVRAYLDGADREMFVVILLDFEVPARRDLHRFNRHARLQPGSSARSL